VLEGGWRKEWSLPSKKYPHWHCRKETLQHQGVLEGGEEVPHPQTFFSEVGFYLKTFPKGRRGRRPPGAAVVGWDFGFTPRLQNCFIIVFSKTFPEGVTADAGSQGVLEGGGGMGGSPSIQISSQSCFQKLSSTGPRRPHASEGAGGEEEKGGSPIHFSKNLFFPKTPSMGPFGSRLPGVLEEGGEEGGAHPPP